MFLAPLCHLRLCTVAALSTVLSTAALDKHPQSKQRGITLDLGFSAFSVGVPLPLTMRAWSAPVVSGQCRGHLCTFTQHPTACVLSTVPDAVSWLCPVLMCRCRCRLSWHIWVKSMMGCSSPSLTAPGMPPSYEPCLAVLRSLISCCSSSTSPKVRLWCLVASCVHLSKEEGFVTAYAEPLRAVCRPGCVPGKLQKR